MSDLTLSTASSSVSLQWCGGRHRGFLHGLPPGLERALRPEEQARTAAWKEAEILIQLCKPPTVGIRMFGPVFGLIHFISLPLHRKKKKKKRERYCGLLNRDF